jgi:hypothetical protein
MGEFEFDRSACVTSVLTRLPYLDAGYAPVTHHEGCSHTRDLVVRQILF